MALGGIWSRVTALLTGGAVAGAAADSVAPVLEAVKQHANAQRAIRVLEPGTAARVKAQRLKTKIDPADDAKRHGVGQARFDALVQLESEAPGTAETLELWRRGKITQVQARRALEKAGLLEEYIEPVLELFSERLSPEVIAVAVQRGIMDNVGLLPVGPPSGVGHVPPMPKVKLDPLAEAKASGYDFDRLAALTRIVGLPPGPVELLQLLNRGVIEYNDFLRGIAEGNLRNEWAPFLHELKRRLLTPHEYAELRLRAWINDEQMHAGAALSGMTKEDTELLRLNLGRPLSWHQVFIGLRRGGTYNGPTGDIDPAFLKALEESNIRPEWYSLAWAQRYSYPSAFVLRGMAQSGELTQQETEQVLLFEGWDPELARKVSHRWSAGKGGSGWNETRAELAAEFEGGYLTEAEYRTLLETHGVTGPALEREVHLGDARRLASYRDKIIDAIGKAFEAFKIDDARATAELAKVSVLGDTAGRLLELWRKQRLASIALLTPAQLKKAYGSNLIDRQTALEELADRGYEPADAVILLDE